MLPKAPKAADFKVHAPVWVKLGSYPWWPARVAPDTSGVVHKAKKVHVIFFGDDTESWVDVKKIRVFDDAPHGRHGDAGREFRGESGKRSHLPEAQS